MIKKLSSKLFLILIISVFFVACEKKNNDGLEKVHWDRDMCTRCSMIISEKGFAVQIVDPTTHKKYKFDDIGCAVLWFSQNNQDWFESAKIWIKDANDLEWIDARKASWTIDNITPMNYGLAAYTKKTFPEGITPINFDAAIKIINEKDAKLQLSRKHALHKRQELKKMHNMQDMK